MRYSYPESPSSTRLTGVGKRTCSYDPAPSLCHSERSEESKVHDSNPAPNHTPFALSLSKGNSLTPSHSPA